MDEVKVKENPAMQGDSAIPHELAAWIHERGYRASWQPIDERYLNTLFGNGFEPLDPEMVKKENPELHKRVFLGSAGTRRLLVDKANNYVRNADTVLMIQSQEAYENMERAWRERLGQSEGTVSPDDPEEMLDAIVKVMGNMPGFGNVRRIDKARSPEAIISEAMSGNLK